MFGFLKDKLKKSVSKLAEKVKVEEAPEKIEEKKLKPEKKVEKNCLDADTHGDET